MALIKCIECDREISRSAKRCPDCGALVTLSEESSQPALKPSTVVYNQETDTFTGTMFLVVKLGMRSIQELGWKLDQVNETLGLVTFQTGISWGSWSGISCSINIEEVSTNSFSVTGSGKQNVRGTQILALNLFGEAESKARIAIDRMKSLASQ